MATKNTPKTIEEAKNKGVGKMSIQPIEDIEIVEHSSEGNLEVVKYLVSKGADINYITHTGANALLAASNNDRVDVVRYLISEGVDLEYRHTGEHGNALLVAICRHHSAIAVDLIDAGADIYAMSVKNTDAFIGAVSVNNIFIMGVLVSKGFDIKKIDAEYYLNLRFALSNSNKDTIKIVNSMLATTEHHKAHNTQS